MSIILLNKGFYQTLDLLQGQETYIYTGFQYHYWNGLLIPYLSIKINDSFCYFPFIGTKFLYLSSTLYCTSCLQSTKKTTWIGWCYDCKDQETNKKFSCIFTKAGQPFGKLCNPEQYALCNDDTFRNHFCAAEYVLYLGRIGSKLKCGIARKIQGGYPQGYHFRILNQGFDEVHVFQGLKPLHLSWAQALEQDIRQNLNIPEAISFQEKYQEISNSWDYYQLDSFNEIVSVIMDAFPELSYLESLFLSSDYWIHPEANITLEIHGSTIPIIRYPTSITGEVYLARGEIVLLNNGDKSYWINLHDLQGHGYIHHEE